MLIKLGLVACAVVAAAAVKVEHPGGPLLVPQVGISKGARSQYPDIIYLSGGHDEHHDIPLGPHGQLDQNNVIAAVYGPAFLRPEWIWNGDHYTGQDREHRHSGYYGVDQYAIYGRGQSNNYARDENHNDAYGGVERNRELHGHSKIDNYQYGRGHDAHEVQPYNDNNHFDHERLLNVKRVQEHEQLLELNRLRERAKLLEIKRLRENAQLKEILREKDHQIHRQRHHRPSIEHQRDRELERHRELERQREYTARHRAPIVENVGDRLHPGYDYTVVGGRGRYADPGYRYVDAGHGGSRAEAGYDGNNADAGYGRRYADEGYGRRNADAGYGGRGVAEAPHGWGPDVSFRRRN